MTCMSDTLLQEQLNYYRARAVEYDATALPDSNSADARDRAVNREWKQAVRALHTVGTRRSVLELAGGTGNWTRELVAITTDLTVLDGAPEMLAINRARINDPRVKYECVDLFDWEPRRGYDLVFLAFWLSHVPPDLLGPFLDKLQRAVLPFGQIFIVDEPGGGQEASGRAQAGMYQQRTLLDGRVFNIVKVYYDPRDLQRRLRKRNFAPGKLKVGEYFFHLISTRRPEI
jgi:SAM-dependent methyltransferase